MILLSLKQLFLYKQNRIFLFFICPSILLTFRTRVAIFTKFALWKSFLAICTAASISNWIQTAVQGLLLRIKTVEAIVAIWAVGVAVFPTTAGYWGKGTFLYTGNTKFQSNLMNHSLASKEPIGNISIHFIALFYPILYVWTFWNNK